MGSSAQNPKKSISPYVDEQIAHLHALQRRIIFLLILASLIPLAFIGTGAGIVFGKIISSKSTEQLQTVVRDHAVTIELFLQERMMALDLMLRSYSKEQITDKTELAKVFENLNKSYINSFLDLGVIDRNGEQLAYIGPYDLLGKVYYDAPWFQHVIKEGNYISDVFMGIRNVPHFIMAVRKFESNNELWILRATINSEVFSNLVLQGRLGKTGDCFILDRQGRYQTPPLFGAKLLDQSNIDTSQLHEDIKTVPAVDKDGKRIIRTMKWMKNGEWMLIAQQEKAELDAPFRIAMGKGLAVFAVGVVIIVLAAFFTTRYLFRLIETATEQKEQLNMQLLQASKLASLGEMATGLAHEINNPLAIITTEQTNISDILRLLNQKNSDIDEMFDSVAMTKKQVMRCKEITQKMLQFGRQHKSLGAPINPGPSLLEIVKLMQHQAKINNVDICLEMEDNLPKIFMDVTELQQLLANISNNAVDAIASKGAIAFSAWSEPGRFRLTIEDTGPGIPPGIKEKIFEPFFTTKSVGKGTGLGLAVCYGIVTKWRGKIKEVGKPGSGAKFEIEFPTFDET